MNAQETIQNLSNQPDEVFIAAGPCSASPENEHVIWELARQNNVAAVRVVGLKSRTAMTPDAFMGWDAGASLNNMQTLADNLQAIQNGNLAEIKPMEIPDSITLARKIAEDTGVLVATETMDASLQIPLYNEHMPSGSMVFWTPSINGIGWLPYAIQAQIGQNGHGIGIKNVKVGGDNSLSDLQNNADLDSELAKTWSGQAAYARSVNPNNVVLIHRGISVAGKGKFRNAPVHAAAQKVKVDTNLPMLYDPSHIHGPKSRDNIVQDTIEAMQMTYLDTSTSREIFLYNGMLLEVVDDPSNVQTDSGQHITLEEMHQIQKEVSRHRNLVNKGES